MACSGNRGGMVIKQGVVSGGETYTWRIILDSREILLKQLIKIDKFNAKVERLNSNEEIIQECLSYLLEGHLHNSDAFKKVSTIYSSYYQRKLFEEASNGG